MAAGERLSDLEPHEIERLFFGHCRMEPPWSGFDFAIDVTATYHQKMAAVRAYEAVFAGDQATLLDKYSAEDRYVGSLVGVPYAETFKARSRCSSKLPTCLRNLDLDEADTTTPSSRPIVTASWPRLQTAS